MMHRYYRALTLASALVLVIGIILPNHTAKAEELTIRLEAEAYEIIDAGNGQQRVVMADFGQLLASGKPALPQRVFCVALPPGARVISVDMRPAAGQELGGTYNIQPAGAAIPLIDDPVLARRSLDEWERNYQSCYNVDDTYPQAAGDFLGEGALRKYRFVRIAYRPLSYRPISGTLTLIPVLEVTIQYDQPAQFHDVELLTDDRGADRAAQLLMNYSQAARWYASPGTAEAASQSYNYVIVTDESLTDAVEPLVQWKRQIGFGVQVVTTSWISGQYQGFDLVERIRNFLIDKYAEWGIEYVLMAGNIDLVPMRQCFSDSANHGSDQWFCPPTDYYYADLTGDWDSDGDGYYGEYGQDAVDFTAEVFVGRIPWSTPADMQAICEKTVVYEQDTGAWKSSALLLGSFAWFDNQNHDSRYLETDMSNLVELTGTDIFTGWPLTRMYEDAGLVPSTIPHDFPITQQGVLNVWGSGQFGIVNWGGHGAPYGTARLVWDWDDGDGVPESNVGELSTPFFIDRWNLSPLDDDHPSIVFATSCNNAYPEEESLARALLRNGAIGTVAATRVAYYTAGWQTELDGKCGTINYFFFDNLVTDGDATGQALYDAKIYYWNNFWDDHYCHHQNLFDFCLYGDPSLQRTGIEYVCTDSDGDGYGDPDVPENICTDDNCPSLANPQQEDADGDGFGDVCDHCPMYATETNSDFVPGDVDEDMNVTSADAIYLVNCVFKGGPHPQPFFECGDADCSGAITSADIIGLVDYVFKGGSAPCDVCAAP
jgi:hypothetical protein